MRKSTPTNMPETLPRACARAFMARDKAGEALELGAPAAGVPKLVLATRKMRALRVQIRAWHRLAIRILEGSWKRSCQIRGSSVAKRIQKANNLSPRPSPAIQATKPPGRTCISPAGGAHYGFTMGMYSHYIVATKGRRPDFPGCSGLGVVETT